MALKNKDMFRYLLEKGANIWNEIHFLAIANLLFEIQWADGLNALLASATMKQVYLALNYFEKTNFIKFCLKSSEASDDLKSTVIIHFKSCPYLPHALDHLLKTPQALFDCERLTPWARAEIAKYHPRLQAILESTTELHQYLH